MAPNLTFELTLNPRTEAIKADLMDWLISEGVDTFVEGCLDHLDLDPPEDGNPDLAFFENATQNQLTVLLLYSYSRDYLEGVGARALDRFTGIEMGVRSFPTEEWTEGWKEYFHPITTGKFYIYPPWRELPHGETRIPLVIDPGMAFGTGQHMTTQLCLRALEEVVAVNAGSSVVESLLDVGTGSGILALGAKKLGIPKVLGCDIDEGSVTAVRENSERNATEFAFYAGSLDVLPKSQAPYGIIMANILYNVLTKMLAQLEPLLAENGFIVLSGILEGEQTQSLCRIGQDLGLSFTKESTEEGWSVLVMQKITSTGKKN